jgi:hypothetical protein
MDVDGQRRRTHIRMVAIVIEWYWWWDVIQHIVSIVMNFSEQFYPEIDVEYQLDHHMR